MTHFTKIFKYLKSCILKVYNIIYGNSLLNMYYKVKHQSDVFKVYFAKRYLHRFLCAFEPRHDKTNKVTVRPAKTQISLGIRPV